MELDSWSRAARGLREHVRQVAAALHPAGTAYWVQTDDPVSAYIPLEHHFYGFPGRDAALLWSPERGWTAVVEDDDEPLVISYLGANLPAPEQVTAFVEALTEGRPAGRPVPPVLTPPSTIALAALAPQLERIA
jgi:hypothetical protein